MLQLMHQKKLGLGGQTEYRMANQTCSKEFRKALCDIRNIKMNNRDQLSYIKSATTKQNSIIKDFRNIFAKKRKGHLINKQWKLRSNLVSN